MSHTNAPDTQQVLADARSAGRNAALALEKAAGWLSSARRRGLVHVFLGGGFFMAQARQDAVHEARVAVRRARPFLEQLGDGLELVGRPRIKVSVGKSLESLDVLISNPVVDYGIHRRMVSLARSVDTVRRAVDQSLQELERLVPDHIAGNGFPVAMHCGGDRVQRRETFKAERRRENRRTRWKTLALTLVFLVLAYALFAGRTWLRLKVQGL